MGVKENISNHLAALTRAQKADEVLSTKLLKNLPERDSVIEIIKDVRALLFPHYFSKRRIDEASEQYIIGDLMLTVYQKLKKQLELAFLYEYNFENKIEECAKIERQSRMRAEEVCEDFFGRLPEIYEILMTDLQAAFDGDPAAENKDQIIFSYPCLLAITVHRIAHILYTHSVPILPRIMSEYAHSKTGIDIHPGATIGRYFFIDHGTGVVIGETTEIGERVKIYQGVTLGALSTREGQLLRGKKRHPTIEDNVTIYSGASVLGGETIIGANSVIGGGAFITSSVPKNTRVSMRNPELRFRGGDEMSEENPWCWEI